MGSHLSIPRSHVRALLTLVCFAACTRDRVDLGVDRLCSSDADCLEGYVCDSGFCNTTGGETCTPTAEVCDGRDNDCNDLADETFACVAGDREACTTEPGERLCLSNCTLSSCTVGWLDGRWSQRLPITLLPAEPEPEPETETLTDLAVPLRFSDAAFTMAGIDPATLIPGGADVRVTSADGTLLSHQVESWSAGTYLVWVRVPVVEPTTAVSLYVYLNNPTAEDASTTAVWDSGFAGVWHLADQAGATELVDATAAAHPAIGRVATPQAGVFASGQAYDGVIGARAPDAGVAAGASFTIEGWFDPNGSAFAYRRTLNVDVPVDDMEVQWDIPDPGDAGDFVVRTGGSYQSIRALDENATMVPFAILDDESNYNFWTRAPTAGPRAITIIYGNSDAQNDSHPEDVFHFWASRDSWNQFTVAEGESATAGIISEGFEVTSGRLATHLSVDLRDGYFVRTYARDQLTDSDPRNSGGLPTIASTPDLTYNLMTPASVIYVFLHGDGDSGGLYTSDGDDGGFNQEFPLSVPEHRTSIGISINANEVSVYAGNTLTQTATSSWQDPLTYLLLGAYDAETDFYPTIYATLFVRRWPGEDAVATATRDRVGGIALGDFAIGANNDEVFISTNRGVAAIPVSSTGSARHVAFVVNDLYSILYVDGEPYDNAQGLVDAYGELTGLSIGDPYSFSGVLDEVRLSSVARSNAYLKFQVHSSSDDLISIGAVETLR